MLTPKQQKLLAFIQDRLADGGVSPSFEEMKDALGLKSKSGIHRMISALEERGFLRRLPNRARALEVLKPIAPASAESDSNVLRPDFGAAKSNLSSVTPPGAETVSIPLHGRIAAGTPIEAIAHADSSMDIPTNMLGGGDHYALEISGDSMIDLGIMDGDTVIIESTNTARDGDVVVALIDRTEATLKTLKRQGQHVMLIPANRDHETQIYEASQIQIQGKLKSLMRTYH